MSPFRSLAAHFRRPLRPHTVVTTAILSTALVAAMIAGCGEEETASCPSAAGRIEGRILWMAPVHARAEVTAEPINTLEMPHTTVTATADSNGRFSLEVPPGSYVLRLKFPLTTELWYSRGEVTGLRARAEILRIGAGTEIRADFPLGGLTVGLDGPEAVPALQFVLESSNPSAPLERIRVVAGGYAMNGRIEARIPALPPRTYRISYQRTGSSEPFWLPGTWDRALADTFVVAAGTVRDYQGSLPEPGAISGTIGGAYGELSGMRGIRSGPEVELYNEDSTTVAISSCDGSAFRIVVPLPGTYKVLVRFDGIPHWVGGTDWETATPFVVAAGQEISGIEVPVSIILCRLEGPGMNVRWSAEMIVHDIGGRPVGYPISPSLFENEYYAAWGLRPGTWFLEVKPVLWNTFLPVWYEAADSLAGATPIVIASDEDIVRITVRLHEPGAAPREPRAVRSAPGAALHEPRAVRSAPGGVR